MTKGHVFGTDAEIAFFAADFERLTPYMSPTESYVGEEHRHGHRIHWVGLRSSGHYWRWFAVSMNIVAGANHRITWASPLWMTR